MGGKLKGFEKGEGVMNVGSHTAGVDHVFAISRVPLDQRNHNRGADVR